MVKGNAKSKVAKIRTASQFDDDVEDNTNANNDVDEEQKIVEDPEE